MSQKFLKMRDVKATNDDKKAVSDMSKLNVNRFKPVCEHLTSKNLEKAVTQIIKHHSPKILDIGCDFFVVYMDSECLDLHINLEFVIMKSDKFFAVMHVRKTCIENTVFGNNERRIFGVCL